MHPAARSGYLYLLAYAWQTDDCSIPSDPVELAEISELGDDLWQTYGPRILRKFTPIEATGKLQNEKLLTEWMEAKKVFDARSLGGKRKDSSKTLPAVIKVTPPQEQEHRQEQEQKDEKQKPSPKPRKKRVSEDGMQHSVDPRHIACKERIFAAYRHKNAGADPDWDGREGQALGMLLRANPALDTETINPLLAHWARSDVNHSDRPSIWIPKLSSFRMAPIDRFNKPKEEHGNGGSNQNHKSPAKQRIDGARRVLAQAAFDRGLIDPARIDGQPSEEIPHAGHE